MRFLIPTACLATVSLTVAAFALIAADQPEPPAVTDQIKKMTLPQYDGNGNLVRPTGYEKWVVVGTSIGLGYSDGEKRDNGNPGTFHNVYLQPEAFDHYVETGKFPEQTVFIVTNNQSQPAKTKGQVSRVGFVAAPTSGLEVAVKDSKRFSDGWAYFMFHGTPGNDSILAHAGQKAFDRASCFDCHAEHAADDNVFTQFYSVLTEARGKRLAKDSAPK